ncbi:hypothetical protein [Nostoc sp.]
MLPRSQPGGWECILIKPLEAESPRIGSQPGGWEPVRTGAVS